MKDVDRDRMQELARARDAAFDRYRNIGSANTAHLDEQGRAELDARYREAERSFFIASSDLESFRISHALRSCV
jgi:hypothetical protein